MPTAQRADPFTSLRFFIEIGQSVKAGFLECGGLSLERKVEEIEEGGVNDHVHKLPAMNRFGNITLKRGLLLDTPPDDDMLWKWYMTGVENGRIQRRDDVSIILYSHDGTTTKRWNLQGAFPVKWQGPALKADGREAAVETLEIAFEGIEMV